MATDPQITANRKNASRSTGPRTETGKAQSAGNALRHGLTATKPLLSGDDPKVFAEFVDTLGDELRPATPLQQVLFELVLHRCWSLLRLPRIESDVFEQSTIEAEAEVLPYYVNDSNSDRLRALRKTLGAAFVQAAGEKGGGRLELLQRYATALERSLYRALAQLRREQAGQGAVC